MSRWRAASLPRAHRRAVVITVHEYPRSHGSLSGLSDTDHHPQYSLDVQDVFANRPLPGRRGRLFFATDLGVYYRDTGTTWTSFGLASGTTIASTATNESPLALQAIAGQIAPLLRFASDTGATLTEVGPFGNVGIRSGASGAISLLVRSSGLAGERGALFISSAADNKALEVRGATGQTGNLFELQKDTGAVIARFDAAATLFVDRIQGNTVPTVVIEPRVQSNSTGTTSLRVNGLASQTGLFFAVHNSDGPAIVTSEPRVGGAQGAHLRLTNPTAATNANYPDVRSPFFLLESRNWDSAAGNQRQFGGLYLGHASTNNPAPESAVIITASRDAVLRDIAYFGGNDLFQMYNSGTIRTGGRVQAHRLDLDFNGNGVLHTTIHMHHADANQMAFLSDHDGDTGYRFLRAAGYNTVSTGDSKTDVQTLDVTGGAIRSQQRGAAKATVKGGIKDRVKLLRPVSYRQMRSDDFDPKTHSDPVLHSFVAEEAAEVMPEIVNYDAKGVPVGIDLGATTTVTLALVQHLLDRVDALEAQLASA